MIDHQAEIARLETELKASGKWQAVIGLIWDRLNLRSTFKNGRAGHEWLSSHFPVDYQDRTKQDFFNDSDGRRSIGHFRFPNPLKSRMAHSPPELLSRNDVRTWRKETYER